LENGVHPKTKAPIKPSPDTLRRLADAYNEEYDELMFVAGYAGNTYAIPENEFEGFIKEMESKYNVNLRDDPIVRASLRQLVESIAQTKISQQNPRNR
jgi:1-aminocyclopropane-1-carboxylate deaminase/D-cysteine desulfhydrase-like pyridoxal-dependent ACC family enzyme